MSSSSNTSNSSSSSASGSSSNSSSASKQTGTVPFWPLVRTKGDLVYKKLAAGGTPPGNQVKTSRNIEKNKLNTIAAPAKVASPRSNHNIMTNAKDIDPNAIVIVQAKQHVPMPPAGYQYSEQYAHQETPFGESTIHKVHYENATMPMFAAQQPQAVYQNSKTAIMSSGQQFQYYSDQTKQTPGAHYHEHTEIAQNSVPTVIYSPPPPPPVTNYQLQTKQFEINIPMFTPQKQMDMIRQRMEQMKKWVAGGGKQPTSKRNKTDKK